MTGSPPGRDATDKDSSRLRPMVLVVEDDVDFCTSLVDILTSRGYSAIPAGTCDEACFLLGELQPEVAIVDMRLPDASGLEVLAYAQQRAPHTGIVILTGYASLDSAVRALNLGAVSYLLKPCKADRVLLAVEKALARAGSPLRSETRVVSDSLLSVLPLPALMFNLETGRVLYANPAAEKLFMSQDSHVPENLFSLPGLRSTEVIKAHADDVKECGQGRTELQIELPGLGSRWYQLLSIRRPKSRQTGFAILVDMTEQKRRQEQQRREHDYLEAIIDNIPIPLAIVGSDYRLQRVSPALARFYYRQPADIVGQPCYVVFHRRSAPCRLHGEVCPISVSIATGAAARAMHQHRDGEGRVRYVESTLAPLRDESGTVTAFITMMIDCTDIKMAQQELEAKSGELVRMNRELTERQRELEQRTAELAATNMQLIQLSAAKDDFVATVSHELRTPLTAISESVSLLSDGSLKHQDDVRAGLLKVAARNCLRLTELIDDLLDLAKLESNRMPVQPVALDIGHLFTETIESFAVLAGDRDVQLVVDPLCEPLIAWADERHARRILSNLVSNAVKFTLHGAVTLSATRTEDNVVVTVTDTGCGIPSVELDRIFEKFYQAKSQRGHRPSGTGLGLAITKKMVEMNGGRIWFETKEGTGTSFHFSLPIFRDATGR